jgi:integrase/recombinase XerD
MEFLEEFKNHLSFERQLSKNTVSSYARDVKQYLKYVEENNIKPQLATPELLDNYLYRIKSDLGLAPASVFRKMEAIKSFYKFMMIENYVKGDPTRFLISPRIIKRVPKQLNFQEIERLLSFPAKTFAEWRTLCIVQLLYASGVRVSELTGLRLENINVQDKWLLACGKGRKQRFIPIHKQACDSLSEYLTRREMQFANKQTDSEVFLNRDGKKLSRVMVWKDIDALGKAAGITKRIHPHLFRHSFASHLLKGGADLRSIQKMLGHESLDTTQIYTHLNVGDLKETHRKLHPRG